MNRQSVTSIAGLILLLSWVNVLGVCQYVDIDTGQNSRYRLQPGEAMTFENLSGASEPDLKDSLMVNTFDASRKEMADALDSLLDSLDPLTLFPELSAMGMVVIPKAYVFILIGILAVGGIMIFIADSTRTRKPKKGTVLQKPDEADDAIADFKMQSVFEAFVITLFDPLYFRHRRPKAERVLAGNVSEGQTGADLEFEFINKETRARFAIKCQYYRERLTHQIRLFSPRRLQVLRDFAEGTEMPLYYILGFGGTPDDPKELFLIPGNAMKNEFVSKAALKPYSKSGMFFYNRKSGRLQ